MSWLSEGAVVSSPNQIASILSAPGTDTLTGSPGLFYNEERLPSLYMFRSYLRCQATVPRLLG